VVADHRSVEGSKYPDSHPSTWIDAGEGVIVIVAIPTAANQRQRSNPPAAAPGSDLFSLREAAAIALAVESTNRFFVKAMPIANNK
jgi:hypothetical protein